MLALRARSLITEYGALFVFTLVLTVHWNVENCLPVDGVDGALQQRGYIAPITSSGRLRKNQLSRVECKEEHNKECHKNTEKSEKQRFRVQHEHYIFGREDSQTIRQRKRVTTVDQKRNTGQVSHLKTWKGVGKICEPVKYIADNRRMFTAETNWNNIIVENVS